MTDAASNGHPRVCVIIPTYNNAVALGATIRAVRDVIADVIVVNDGSTDATDSILARIPGITVLTQPCNTGKGGALARGLAYAQETGFTHAITMDGDGQHLASDLPRFISSIAAHPAAVVIGMRRLPRGRRPLKSRLLRTHSNFWVWVETGRWVHDTQSGYRAYPLAAVNRLFCRTARYDFEIELLVKAIWCGSPTVQIPVTASYGPGSESHFRPLRDFALVARLNTRLVAQRLLLPPALLAAIHTKAFRQRRSGATTWIVRQAFFSECNTPRRLAACVGIGVVFGILPIWGAQMAVAMIIAHRLGLSKALAVAATNISFPAILPLIIWASVMLGRLLLTGQTSGMSGPQDLGSISLFTRCASEYLVGSVALALAAGLAATAIAYTAASIAAWLWKGKQ